MCVIEQPFYLSLSLSLSLSRLIDALELTSFNHT